MTTSTWVNTPPRTHLFKSTEIYWLAEEHDGAPIGTPLVTVSGWSASPEGRVADGDDEVQFAVHGYVRRDMLSTTAPVPLDTPPSLDPKEVARWLLE